VDYFYGVTDMQLAPYFFVVRSKFIHEIYPRMASEIAGLFCDVVLPRFLFVRTLVGTLLEVHFNYSLGFFHVK